MLRHSAAHVLAQAVQRVNPVAVTTSIPAAWACSSVMPTLAIGGRVYTTRGMAR